MRHVAADLLDVGLSAERIRLSMERNMKCGVGLCGHCQLREFFLCVRRPGAAPEPARHPDGDPGAVMTDQSTADEPRRPTLAVWKFASCDGCQLTLLNCEDELLALAGAVEIAYFPEATRAVVEGPYDLSLVEGSITTPEDVERIQEVRRVSRRLVTIGACATSGGIQALRNFARRRGVPLGRLRPAVVHQHPRDLDADRGPRRGRLPAARLPDRPGPAARGAVRVPAGPAGPHPGVQRLRRVQAARQRLRHGRPRHAVPRTGDPCRLRRAVPVVRPRLLRLLRRRRARRTRRRWPTGSPCSGCRERDVGRVFRTFTAAAEPFRSEGTKHLTSTQDEAEART